MQLAKFTDYALRVLMHLSVAEDYVLSTRQIAEIHDARFHHLAKVTHWLSREGYVATIRGRGGGLRLARAPEEINIGCIVRGLESADALVDCLTPGGGHCILSPTCGLTPALREAQEAFFKILDRYRLADLIPPDGRLVNLLRRLNAPISRIGGG